MGIFGQAVGCALGYEQSNKGGLSLTAFVWFGVFFLGKTCLKNLAIVLFYVGAGKLSLLSAVAGGYISPVSIPAGIGLAVVLLLDERYAITVGVGAFLLNFWISSTAMPSTGWFALLILALSLSLAAWAQAIAGSYLVRRYVTSPTSLISSTDILNFLWWGGPVACLVGTSLTVGTLAIAGLAPPSALAFLAWTTWAGNTVGVILTTPIIFCLFSSQPAVWAHRRMLLPLPLALTIALCLAMFWYTRAWQRKTIQLEFDRSASELAHQVKKNFDGYLNSLYALEGIVSDQKKPSRLSFRTTAQRWLSLHPEIYALAWSPRIRWSERDAYVAEAKKAGISNYEIREISAQGNLVKAPKRPEYISSFFVEPYRPKTSVLGFDISSNPERNLALLQTLNTGLPAVAGPIQLIQNIPDRLAVLVYLGVYDGEHNTAINRKKNLRGYVSAVFRVKDVIDASSVGQSREDFLLSLYDQPAPSGRPIYVQKTNQNGKDARRPFTIPSFPPFQWETVISLADRTFWLRIVPTEGLWLKQTDYSTWVVLASELLMGGLLVALLLTTTGHAFVIETELAERLRITKQLELRTAQLSRSNADLEQFAYVASHDLKEPLRSVTNYVQLLSKRYSDRIDANATTYIRFAVEGSARMYALIDDLLEYARVDRENFPLELVSAHDLLASALKDLGVSTEDDQTKITCSALPKVWASPSQLTRVFQNLVGNAIKYRKAGQSKIHIQAERQSGHWLFSVSDNGIGIDSRYFERIFSVFQRLHRREEYPGTGIGLAICKRVVQRHGGEIWLTSHLGEGSTFFFTLPIEPLDA